jgi:hypothetical protein
MSDSSSQERPAQRSPAPADTKSEKDPLGGDWSEGLPGSAHPHGLPLPVPLEVTPQAPWMAAPESAHTAPDTSEIALPVPEPMPPASANGDIAGWTSPAEPLPEDAITEPLPDSAIETQPLPESATPPAAAWDGAAANEPPPAPGGELTPEPPTPSWMEAPRPVLAPLAPGESLGGDDPDPMQPSSPPALQVVPAEPEELDDPNLLVPVENVAPAPTPAPVPAGDMVVPGEQRVAVHTRAGRTRRGTVVHLDLSRAQFALQPQGGGSTEMLAQRDVKAIFFMLAPGEQAPLPEGQLVRITLEDSHTIEGHLAGRSDANGFFLVPTDAQKTNTRCIYVARAVVSNVAPI